MFHQLREPFSKHPHVTRGASYLAFVNTHCYTLYPPFCPPNFNSPTPPRPPSRLTVLAKNPGITIRSSVHIAALHIRISYSASFIFIHFSHPFSHTLTILSQDPNTTLPMFSFSCTDLSASRCPWRTVSVCSESRKAFQGTLSSRNRENGSVSTPTWIGRLGCLRSTRYFYACKASRVNM